MASTHRRGSEVSCVIKYLVFGFNVLFWITGGLLAAAGIWAWSEKDIFSNLTQVARVPDPALFFIIIGLFVFIVGYAGCVGALRENTILLLIYCAVIGLLFAAELVLGILAFIYKDWMANVVKDELKDMLVKYREDSDLQNVIDWVQKDWLQCCGVEGFRDWEKNEYFNCSSPSVEACGVPFSCCKFKIDEFLINTQCGYGVMHHASPTEYIHTEGCLDRGEVWMNENLIPVAGVIVAVALIQILGICFAMNLRGDILAQKSRWNYRDTRSQQQNNRQ